MAFISQDEINQIRSSASIVDVISSYIPLTPKGKNYFGVCPFHNDHSPSMSVSPDKQIYKCFTCGATGNVFTFVENYLNISFAEAVETVARSVGISIQISDTKKKDNKYKNEYELMDFVLRYYQNNLNTEVGKKAITYLNERGMSEDTIKDFSIGLSLDKNSLYHLLNQKGYKDDLLVDLGLVSKKENEIYDVFQNRIMFPIHDLEGNALGFTARCYLSEINPKYLNTRETFLFKKGNILFNYHRAKDAIRLSKQLIIVEGNMDAIRLYTSGVKNVIALMGTSLTREQIIALKKLRCQIILMLDNDDAGENATFNVGNTLEEEEIPFMVVRLSGAKDPDEYILKYGVEKIQEVIKNSISFMDFKLAYFKKNKNLTDAADLAEYIKSIIESLKNNSDEILKEVTLQKLSNDYNISYVVLKEQLEKNETPKQKIVNETFEIKEVLKKDSYDKLCEEILFYMMNSYTYIKLYQTRLGIFPTKEHRMIANEIIYYYEKNKDINLADFITYIETNPLRNEIMDIINNEKDFCLSEEGMLELLYKVRKKIQEQEIKKLKNEVKNEFDINKKMALLEKIAELKKGSVENENN